MKVMSQDFFLTIVIKMLKVMKYCIPLAGVLLVLSVVNHYYLLVGRATFHTDFSKKNAPVVVSGNVFTPEHNLETGMIYKRVIGDQVNIAWKLPSAQLEKFDVEVTYRNSSQGDVRIEVPLKSIFNTNEQEIFSQKKILVLENFIIDTLKQNTDWVYQVDTEKNVMLFQRVFFEKTNISKIQKNEDTKKQEKEYHAPRYDSVSAFLSNTPQDARIQTFNFDLLSHSARTRVSTLDTPTEPMTYQLPFRGTHTLLISSSQDRIDLDLRYRDYNDYAGADDIQFFVTSGSQMVFQQTFPDDDNKTSNRKKSEEQNIHFEVTGIRPGYYTVAIITSQDIRFQSITTPQLFFFEKHLLLANARQRLELWASSPELTFAIAHKGDEQTVTVGEQKIKIGDLHKKYTVENLDGVQKFIVEKASLAIDGSGFLAPTHQGFEFLDLVKHTPPLDTQVFYAPAGEQIEYVLVDFGERELVRQAGDWKTIRFSVDPRTVQIEDDIFSFFFKIPAYQEVKDDTAIRDIIIKAYGQPRFFQAQ